MLQGPDNSHFIGTLQSDHLDYKGCTQLIINQTN